LYEYYDSKDEIIAAICELGMEGLSTSFEEISPHLSPTQQLIQMSLAYVKFAVRNPEQFLLIFNSLPASRVTLDEPVFESSPYAVILGAVEAAIETGEIKVQGEDAAEGVAFNLWALMHGRAMLQLTFLRNFQADFEGAHRWAIESFFKGLNMD
jgi:AcrR family transcriptional regulator